MTGAMLTTSCTHGVTVHGTYTRTRITYCQTVCRGNAKDGRTTLIAIHCHLIIAAISITCPTLLVIIAPTFKLEAFCGFGNQFDLGTAVKNPTFIDFAARLAVTTWNSANVTLAVADINQA